MTHDQRAAIVGAVWTAVALIVLTVVFGSPDRPNHQSPDEAGVAHGSMLVAEFGRPVEPLPFDDPGGSFHQRLWVRVDGGNTPTASTPGLYLLGAPTVLPGGAVWRFLLPSLGLGALAGGVALLLPTDRRAWLGAAVPGLAFPALYWWLRPWHNTSTMLAFVGLGVLGVALHRRTGRFAWSIAATASVTAAAAVRPDQVHVLLGSSLLLQSLLARESRDLRRHVASHLTAGAALVVALVAANLVTTGSAMVTPVDLLDFPSELEPVGRDLGFPWSQLLLIFASQGVPDPVVVLQRLGRYGLTFGPFVAVLGLAAIAVGVGWARRPRVRPQLVALAALAALWVWYPISRVSTSDYGSTTGLALMQHSFPRYVCLVTVIMAVGTVFGVAHAPRARALLWSVTALVSAAGAVFVLAAPVPQQSLLTLRGQLTEGDRLAEAVDRTLPTNAVVWVSAADKWMWHTRPTGLWVGERDDPRVPDTDAVIPAVTSARAAGYEAWFLDLGTEDIELLGAALVTVGLRLQPTGFTTPGASSTPPRLAYRAVPV